MSADGWVSNIWGQKVSIDTHCLGLWTGGIDMDNILTVGATLTLSMALRACRCVCISVTEKERETERAGEKERECLIAYMKPSLY